MAKYLKKQSVLDYLNEYLNALKRDNYDTTFHKAQRKALRNIIQDIQEMDSTEEKICEVRAMAEYVVVLTGYVLVDADSEEEAIEKALNEAPNEMSAEIVEIHYLAD